MSDDAALRNGLKSFCFSQFRFTLSPVEILHLPRYKGSTLRGGFGTAFKRMVCIVKGQSCITCIIKDKCAYSYIFETPRSATGGAEWGASHDPHPFVIEPPLEARQKYLAGEDLVFDLILIGKGADYFPYFILAFEELGKMGIGKGKGNCQLLKVENFTDSASKPEELMYDGESRTLSTKYRVTSFENVLEQIQRLNPHAITLHFLTPTRIKHRGNLTKYMDFEIFIRNLLRRLSWLSELYCSERWDLDYATLLAQARYGVHTNSSRLWWCDLERYSARQNTRLKMGGFMGSITFEGELGEFLPFIKLGEYLHIGKGTAYGLGKYLIESSQVI